MHTCIHLYTCARVSIHLCVYIYIYTHYIILYTIETNDSSFVPALGQAVPGGPGRLGACQQGNLDSVGFGFALRVEGIGSLGRALILHPTFSVSILRIRCCVRSEPLCGRNPRRGQEDQLFADGPW